MRAHRLAPLALLLLAGCAVPDPGPAATARLPDPASTASAGDPVRGALISSAFVFGQPGSVAAQPAAAAEALGQLEFLTVELAGGAYAELDPLALQLLREGRAQARQAFGLRQDVPPQAAIDALFGAAAALRAGDRAAAEATLAQVTEPGAAPAALAKLSALPRLPQAASGTRMAYNSIILPRDRLFMSLRMF